MKKLVTLILALMLGFAALSVSATAWDDFKSTNTASSWTPLSVSLWNTVINKIWDLIDDLANISLTPWPQWDVGPAWATWATWLAWSDWAQGLQWNTWATWAQWIQWDTWPQWPAWATWATWLQWIQWIQWDTWPAWTSWSWEWVFWLNWSNAYYTWWNVWIWMTNPSTNLEVNKNIEISAPEAYTSSLFVSWNNNEQVWPLAITQEYNDVATIINRSNASLAIGTNNQTRMLINSSGSIGVWTISPWSKLDVNWDIRAQQLCDESWDNCKDISTGWIWDTWPQWPAWATWATWAQWDQWIQWLTWDTWAQGPQWNTWATWDTWASPFWLNWSDAYYIAWDVGIGTSSPGTKLHILDSSAGSSVQGYVQHSGNASVSEHANMLMRSGGASGGDPYYRMSINGVDEWAMWLDNSDWDKFKISNNSVLGTNDRLTINNAGNAGIGTASPLNKLHIDGNIRMSDNEINATNKSVAIIGSQYLTTESEGFLSTGVQGLSGINRTLIGGGFWSLNASTEINFFTAADVDIRTGAQRMTIDNTGNVGIGTSNPWSILNISDTYTNTPTLRISNEADRNWNEGDIGGVIEFYSDDPDWAWPWATSYIRAQHLRPGSGHSNPDMWLAFWASDGSSKPGDPDMVIAQGGNVGIGTTSPKMPFQIKTYGWFDWNANELILRGNKYYDSGKKYLANGFATEIALQTNSGDMYFKSSDTGTAGTAVTWEVTNMAIKQDGKVGIGTTSPQGKLDVSWITNTKGVHLSGVNARNDPLLTIEWSGIIGGSATDQGLLIDIDSYVDASTLLNIKESGSSVMLVNGAGNVGIGTTSPDTELHTVWSATTQGVATFENDVNTSDVNHWIVNIQNTKTYAVDNDARVMFSSRSDVWWPWGWSMNPMASMWLIVEGDLQGALQFNTRSSGGWYSEKMRISNDGNIGINTTSPWAPLEIALPASTADTLGLRLSNKGNLNYYWEMWRDNVVGDLRFGEVLSGAAKVISMTIESVSGNVGIWTTTPSNKLTVYGNNSSTGGLSLYSGWPSDTSVKLDLYGIDRTYYIDHSELAANMAFAWDTHFRTVAADATRTDMTIEGTSGNIGIGTTSPNHKLQVEGNIFMSKNPWSSRYIWLDDDSTWSGYLALQAGWGSDSYWATMVLYSNAHTTKPWNVFIGTSAAQWDIVLWKGLTSQVPYMTVKPSGNVGIGDTTPDSKLDVNWTIRANEVCDESWNNCKDLSWGWDWGWAFSIDWSDAVYTWWNVWIWKTSPAWALDVQWLVNYTPAAIIRGSVNAGSSYGASIMAGSSNFDYSLMVKDKSGTKDYFKVRGDGKISIWNSDPKGTVHIESWDSGATPYSWNNDLVIENDGQAGIGIYSPDNSTSNLSFWSPSEDLGAFIRWMHLANTMYFYTMAGWKMDINGHMFINWSWSVSIGDSTPGSTLEVNWWITPDIVTADPCSWDWFQEGSMFYNDTSNYYCYCNQANADVKMHDPTTACF